MGDQADKEIRRDASFRRQDLTHNRLSEGGPRLEGIGEQEILPGPRQYKTVDGTFPEHICLNYDIEAISGFPTNQLVVTYFGEDSRLTNRKTLSLADVGPILKEWGY
jgi:hypothetical protein